MIVTLIYQDKISTLMLPEKIEGQFSISTSSHKKIVEVEGNEKNWVMKSSKKVKILNAQQEKIKSVVLDTNSIYQLEMNGEIAYVYCEASTKDRNLFQKYAITEDMEITIGRESQNIISYAKPIVSASHAILIYHNKYWTIRDYHSTNGTFVNDIRVEEKDLSFGDTISIMGLKIIVGYDFFAINNPDQLVTIKEGIFQPFQKTDLLEEEEEEEEEELSKTYFYRSPRLKREIEQVEFKIDSPPPPNSREKLPLILTLGPSVTMGLASLTSTIFAVNNAISSGNMQTFIPSIAMSGSMLLGTLLWPMVTKFYDKNARKKYEKKRISKYSAYLKDLEKQMNQAIKLQEEILKENFVTIDECEDRILKTERTLWERGLWQEDFLQLRLGIGNLPFSAKVSYPEKTFSLEDDSLREKMYELCEKPKILKDVPITLSFYQNYITGIIGEKKKVFDFAKGLIFELASLYSYDEVKMIFLYQPEDSQELEFVKWLPHTFTNDKKFRLIATNLLECKELSYFLEDEIMMRSEEEDQKMEGALPYYIVFVFDQNLGLKTEMLSQLYAKKKNINFSILNLYQKLEDLPKECSMVIELFENQAKMYDKNNVSSTTQTFHPDIYLTADPNSLSKKLANTFLNTLESGYQFPAVYQFLQMFQVGQTKHLNVLNRWKENDPTKSLATPIGVDSYGELFQLDLHEKFHGPHGLVAGMTGSGKSEFIMTYILSLAVNYHPHEVSFILIDYKGGGMAKSFQNLPHTAGIITNLDGASIKRTLTSINSELKRRQAIFDEASRLLEISNIDIYKYQKLYREQKVKVPLPHLFIISDEFAELKSQQPEFMQELVSAARIGRSLGIHLILATQKPNGVVDDQIWSNSRFRICLKVQEKADSMDMLKRPDAALLKETGRFYLQVGYNELFELGQSAWAGAPYYPKEKFIQEKDDSVVIIDQNARVLKEEKVDKNKNFTGKIEKQLDVITKYIAQTAKEEKIEPLAIWLPPLKEVILLEELEKKYQISPEEKYHLEPVIGEYDDPIHQYQNYLKLTLSNQNTILYGSVGSGKSMLLTTILYSILKNHSPEEVNLYLLDFESETLTAFEKAPQVGEVILSNDTEKINNLFQMLLQEMKKRKQLFSNFGGNYYSYLEESGKTLPSLLIAISNYAAFTEIYPEKEEMFHYLTREGNRYGIDFLITATGPNVVKYKVQQNFGQSVVLNFHDEANYSLVLGKTNGLIPSHYEGRGLIKLEKEIYEFQTARITEEKNPDQEIRKLTEECLQKYPHSKATRVAVLPKIITEELLLPYLQEKLIVPIGMEKNTLQVEYWNLEKQYIHLALANDSSYFNFFQDFVNLSVHHYTNYEFTVVDPKGKLEDLDKSVRTVVGQEATNQWIAEFFQLILERNNAYKDAFEKKEKLPDFSNQVIFLNSFADIIENKDSTSIEKLELALEKGSKDYHVTVIIFEEAKKISTMSAKKWYKEQVKLEEGLWFGRGFSNQYVFTVSNLSQEVKKDVEDASFAIFIQKGTAKKIKILNSKGSDSDE